MLTTSSLAGFEQKEKAKSERDHALNSLESAVYDYQARLGDEADFSRYGTVDELTELGALVAKLKEWLEEAPEAADAGADELKAKKRELDAPARKIKYRRRQKEVCPMPRLH